MDMVWAPFRTQCNTALLTLAHMLPLFMAGPFMGPFSGSDAAAYHTEEAVDEPLEADAAEVSASGDGGRYREVVKEFILLLSDCDRKKLRGGDPYAKGRWNWSSVGKWTRYR